MRDGFVYVYGVSAAHPLRDPPAGVDGMPVEFVDHGSLRARLRRSQGGGSLAQRIQLGELVVSELVRARNADTRLALDVLEPHSVSYAEELATGDDAAFNLAFLVERDRDSAFGRAVARLR